MAWCQTGIIWMSDGLFSKSHISVARPVPEGCVSSLNKSNPIGFAELSQHNPYAIAFVMKPLQYIVLVMRNVYETRFLIHMGAELVYISRYNTIKTPIWVSGVFSCKQQSMSGGLMILRLISLVNMLFNIQTTFLGIGNQDSFYIKIIRPLSYLHNGNPYTVNSLRPSDIYMHQ